MATLDLKDIKQLIEQGVPDWVKQARKYTRKLQVHINGIDTAGYLDSITGFENSRQYDLRKKYATSNKFVFENLLRPIDKVFSANGGSNVIRTKTKDSEKLLDLKLGNIKGGYSLFKWIENIQSNKFYSDSSGLTFFEWNEKDTYPTLKSIGSILNYKTKGSGRQIEWVVFEPEQREGKDGNFYRVVDDSFDYMIYENGGDIMVIEDETFVNPWGYVPAFTNSNIINSELTYHISPIDSVIDLADHYLRTTSVKNIYEFLHGFPIFWAYVQPCRNCDGTGLYDGSACPSCNGDGHTFSKDVSDVIKLKPPTSKEDPQLAPDVAGYVQPDLQTWDEQRNELDWLWGLMHFSMWGTAQQEKADNETATAAFINVQPVNDRLNKISDAYEQTEQLSVDIVGFFYARDNYEGASINKGRRFLVEPPDVIWKKYQDAKAIGAPKITLDYLLIQYYQSEFKDDVQSMVIANKGVKIEPFIHKTDEEINNLPVMDDDKLAKYYFNEFWRTLTTEELLIKDTKSIESKFQEYLNNKKLSNEQKV